MAKRKAKEAPASEAVSKPTGLNKLNIDLKMEIDQQFGGHKLKITVALTDENGAKLSEAQDWVTIPV